MFYKTITGNIKSFVLFGDGHGSDGLRRGGFDYIQKLKGKAKYLIGVKLDPVLAVFKFRFHEIFVDTKNITAENAQIFASTIIITN